MRLRSLRPTFVATLVLGAACSGDEGGKAPGAGGTGGTSAADCGKDTDCPGTMVCLGGRCVEPLGRTDSGPPPECTTAGDCATGEVCEAGKCIRPGSCTSAPDRAAVEATYMLPNVDDGGMMEAAARDVARQCGIECLFSFETEAEQRVCTHECILEKTGMSSECADCYVASVDCGRTHCLTECVGSNHELCFQCTCGDNLMSVNCIEPFETCSGLPSTTCDEFGG